MNVFKKLSETIIRKCYCCQCEAITRHRKKVNDKIGVCTACGRRRYILENEDGDEDEHI